MALKGRTKKILRQDSKGKLYLSVAIPIKNIRMVRGAVLLSVSGKKIEQDHSYIAGNNIFCVYNAESEDFIKEHSERAGVPANEITLISNILEHNTSND